MIVAIPSCTPESLEATRLMTPLRDPPAGLATANPGLNSTQKMRSTPHFESLCFREGESCQVQPRSGPDVSRRILQKAFKYMITFARARCQYSPEPSQSDHSEHPSQAALSQGLHAAWCDRPIRALRRKMISLIRPLIRALNLGAQTTRSDRCPT